MTPEQTNRNPEQLIALKDALLERWQQLPPEHQATMALVLLEPVMESEWGGWMRRAITLRWPGETGVAPPQEEAQETILNQWYNLSPDQQAALLVRQLQDVLGSGLSAPLRRELRLSDEDAEVHIGDDPDTH